MSLDLRRLQPGHHVLNLVMSATSGQMTKVLLPKWIGTVDIMPRGEEVRMVDGDLAADATAIGARAYRTLASNVNRSFPFRAGATRPDIENWPPSFALSPTTTNAITVEIELRPWVASKGA
jgi:hypothetical protein